MSRENLPEDTFSKDRAELFEALGHPTRIKILELLANSQMGFSDLKKSLNIESSGQLQFHLSKLQGLIKTVEGNYALTDGGREALRIVTIKESVKTEAKVKHSITPLQSVTTVLAIALVITMAFSIYNFQLQTQNFNNLNQSLANLNLIYNIRDQQFNNLLNQFYSGGVVAQLSNCSEFKSAAQTMSAKYFSINSNSGVANIAAQNQINGYLWDENNTFILAYSATVNSITFQVSNIYVYQPVCIGCGENMTLAIPQMQDYVTYVIQGSH